MRIRDEDPWGEPEFSMAPLIDVVFQLLIFFMVATTYTTSKEKELGIDLPQAQSATEPGVVPDEIVINLFRDGHVTLGGRAVARDALATELAAVAQSNQQVPVSIRGDRLVHHEDVVAVMDACGMAGLSNLSVGTLDR